MELSDIWFDLWVFGLSLVWDQKVIQCRKKKEGKSIMENIRKGYGKNLLRQQ